MSDIGHEAARSRSRYGLAETKPSSERPQPKSRHDRHGASGLVLLLLLSTSAFAQDAGVPVIHDVPAGESLVMFGPGRCLNEPAWVDLGQRMRAVEIERDKASGVSLPVVLVTVGLVLLGGGVAGYAIGRAVK